ncbi:MAG: hypothetical protein QOJ73_5935, partial [Streptosporangiaceae bacterium]|nr:hypothetical protein [Streptosporangiaceae bacterium]
MAGQMPDHGPDAGQAAPRGPGRPQFAWLAGSAEAGPVPGHLLAGSGPPDGGPPDGGPVSGRSVSGGGRDDAAMTRGLDWQALLEALAAAGIGAGAGEGQEGVLGGEGKDDARGARLLPARQLAALGAEHITPGPAQAGWLGVAAGAPDVLDEDALVGVVVAARRLTAWAQATELTAVARIAECAAAADPKIGLSGDGRPGRLCQDAISQVSLALMLSDYSAGAWADLAVTLRWRLPATGKALAAGRIDMYRARLIAEGTSMLSEEVARAVEKKILPNAGGQVTGELRARLRRAVIAADPEGAERRRKQAERHAKVSLYGDEDGTAVLTGSKLPAVEAAAAMARITALARAMKAAGQAGGLDLHRAKVMLSLLLGTLPYIPPADGAPPDEPPPGGDSEPGGGEPGRPADPDGPGVDGPGVDGTGGPQDSMPGPADGGPWGDLPDPRDEDAPDDDGPDDGPNDDSPADDGWTDNEHGANNEHGAGRDDGDDLTGAGGAPVWPALGAIPPALARRPDVQRGDGKPVPGLLDVTLPWTVLAGLSSEPGTLGRIGPITAIQARQLAQAADADPAAEWRVIVTNGAGQAIAVSRIRRRRARDGPDPGRDGPGPASEATGLARDGPLPGAGLVGRVTVTIGQDVITDSQHRPGGPGPPSEPGGPGRPGGPGGPGPVSGIAAAALRAAARALAWALAQAQADEAAGGCAHQGESPAYRPPPRLREFVTARDVTCRFPPCRQP